MFIKIAGLYCVDFTFAFGFSAVIKFVCYLSRAPCMLFVTCSEVRLLSKLLSRRNKELPKIGWALALSHFVMHTHEYSHGSSMNTIP